MNLRRAGAVWASLARHSRPFESAVLTIVGGDGYPTSVRCRPKVRAESKRIEVQLPDWIETSEGAASLLFHRHDNNLFKMKDFLLRGRLEQQEDEWMFVPVAMIPGILGLGPRPAIRNFLRWRRNTRRYFQRRGVARPRVPWGRIKALKREAKKESVTAR